MKILYTLGLIYLSMVLALYLFQRKLQYHPFKEQVPPSHYGLNHVEEVSFDTEDGERINAWYAKAKEGRPTFLYFHGNAEAIQHRWERVRLFTEHGYGILIVSWRGYAGSTGTPTETGLHLDAKGALRFLEVKGLKPSDLIYFGESLGSGVAVPLAAQHPPAAIMLDSPFTSAADVGQHAYWYVPTRFLLNDKFNSMAHVGKISSPVFIFHGDADQVVPFKFGQELYAALPSPKEFVRLPGAGHVEPLTPDLWQKMKVFMEKYTGSP
ncbi:MAG: alpha/beta hydrolase [Alphaproteobacteria bacterium]|nr:alpha/beta hydrolase [Alphaproteobacteria bacterium]